MCVCVVAKHEKVCGFKFKVKNLSNITIQYVTHMHTQFTHVATHKIHTDICRYTLHTYTLTHIHNHTNAQTHIKTYTSTQTHTQIHIQAHIHTQRHTGTHTHMHRRRGTQEHIYTCTHTYTHTHAYYTSLCTITCF